jgi:hypothetical protein
MISPNKRTFDQFLIEDALLANSETFSVGDAVIIDTSAPNTIKGAKNTTGILFGVIEKINNGVTGGGVSLQKSSSVTTAADNATNAKITATVRPFIPSDTYVVDLSAAAGTTTNSQYFGYFNLTAASNSTLNEASYSASTEKQFLSYGLVPNSTTQVVGVFTKIAQA